MKNITVIKLLMFCCFVFFFLKLLDNILKEAALKRECSDVVCRTVLTKKKMGGNLSGKYR